MRRKRQQEAIRILLTGFNSFPGTETNPTKELVTRLGGLEDDFPSAQIRTVILDTTYRCDTTIRQALLDFLPHIFLGFGASSSTSKVKIERIALNLDDSELPDNSGEARRGQAIVPDGPLGYMATLPLETIYNALHRANIPAFVSNHAGTYVCNHLFYFASHLVSTLGLHTLVGFIHIPSQPAQDPEPGCGLLDMTCLVKGASLILDVALASWKKLEN